MELRHIRYFLATVDAGSVSQAALALHITQPGLSRQLQQLERELGLQLFERRGGRLHPSRASDALLPLARDLLERVEEFQSAARMHALGHLDTLTIGAPTVTLTDVVAPFIATLGSQDPRADVLEADGLTPSEVLTAGADLAIGTSTPTGFYGSCPLAVLPVWAYVPPDHPWADRSRVSLSDLLTETVIGLPPAYTAREALDVAAVRGGATYSSIVQANNGTVAQALAAAGRGVAVVSDDPRFDLVPLAIAADDTDRPLSIRLVATWSRRHPAAATVEEIAERLGHFVRERYAVAASDGKQQPSPIKDSAAGGG